MFVYDERKRGERVVSEKNGRRYPPHVEYSLTKKGESVVPILQKICQWSGIFYREDSENVMTQCQKCDYR
ncbi:MAG: winged helix-turn-helix transcriptional regulator [Roseburia sp.]